MVSPLFSATGDVQRMPAGTGISDRDFNHSPAEPVHSLQIWLQPSRQGQPVSSAQQSFSDSPPNGLALSCWEDVRAGSTRIDRNADMLLGRLDPKEKVNHPLRDNRYAWVQWIEGDPDLNGNTVSPGDGISIDGEKELRFASKSAAHCPLLDLN